MRLLFVLLLLTSNTFSIAESSDTEPTYLCVAEESTGFIFDNGEWKRASFNINNHKYILRKLKKDEKPLMADRPHSYGLYKLGSNKQRFSCFHNIDFYCEGIAEEFYFSPESGKYLMSYMLGYWKDEYGSNTPSISRGRCSKI